MMSHFSYVQFFVTPWTVAHQAPLSMVFSRQEYRSGLTCPSPGHLPDPGIEPTSLTTPTLAGGFFATSITWEALEMIRSHPRPLGKAASEEEGKNEEGSVLDTKKRKGRRKKIIMGLSSSKKGPSGLTTVRSLMTSVRVIEWGREKEILTGQG